MGTQLYFFRDYYYADHNSFFYDNVNGAMKIEGSNKNMFERCFNQCFPGETMNPTALPTPKGPTPAPTPLSSHAPTGVIGEESVEPSTTLPLVPSHAPTGVIGAEYVVECLDDGTGDTALFTATIKSLLPGDSLLLGPCNYQFDENYIIGRMNAPDSDKFENAEGVLIKGTGQNPAQTVLNAIIEWFPVNVMFENLTINGKQSTSNVFYTDGSQSALFRRCVLIAGNLSHAPIAAAVYALSGRLTFIDSKIINGYTSATEAEIGVWTDNSVVPNKINLMRSSIEEFPIGLSGGNWGPDTQNLIQVHKTTLSSNTIECCARLCRWGESCYISGEVTCDNDVCPLDSQTMNTPKGKSRIKMNEMVDLLGEYTYSSYYPFITYLPLTISSRKVQTGGYTLAYKLLSAHPALPMYKDKQYNPGNAAPQYFQFDSSATFSNKKGNKIWFDKSVIDSNFNNPNKIKAFQSVDGKVWKNKPLKVKVKVTNLKNAKGGIKYDVPIYQVKFRRRQNLKF